MDSDETVVGGAFTGTNGSLPAGTQIGEYRVLSLLGRGAMGQVYEVEQVRMGRRYALKLLPQELQRDAEFRRRFEQEARTLAGLEHPNIVQVVYVGESPVGDQPHAYLVMELLHPLSEWLKGESVPNEDTVRSILQQVLLALDYAHGRGVVHRDLKPANLLRTGSGEIKIGDFGVARVVGRGFMRTVVERTVAESLLGEMATHVSQGSSGQVSSSHGYVGTIHYIAPEVLVGGEAIAQSDLYAVGVMAYEWLTGRKPIGRVKAVSRVRADLRDDWVDALLEYEPGDRITNAKAALATLPYGSRTAAPCDESHPVKETVQVSTAHTAPTVVQPPELVEGENALLDLPGGVPLELVWIAPGEFTMGSPERIVAGGLMGLLGTVVQEEEEGRFPDEGPQTRVRLSKGYWLGQTPLTQGQWEALMGSNPSHFKGSGLNAPVESVSRDEAMGFVLKLTDREREAGRLPAGYVYTLPSEAQWEYACRAGTSTRFYSGNTESDLGRAGWFSENSGKKTHPVGQKEPNAWGLYDMHGNVWEWTRSWFRDYPGGSVIDYEALDSGSDRVLRGGSWSRTARLTRSASRLRLGSGYSWNVLGFRLCLSPVR